VRAAPLLACALALAVAASAHADELLREEAYAFRIVGSLPSAWTRDGTAPAWTFRFEGLPHAHVTYGRQHVESAPDPLDALEARATFYRFPTMPNDAQPRLERTTWGGLPAAHAELSAEIGGVLCVRRVTAAVFADVFVECIETVYGARTEELPGCRDGLETLRNGFQPLLSEVPPEERTDPTPRAYEDPRLGCAFRKPQGLLRLPVDPAADPGCRYAFQRAGPKATWLLVRLFEYGKREAFEPEEWCKEFFRAFAMVNLGAERAPEPEEAPRIDGARAVHAERFTGTRDGRPVVERVLVMQGTNGVVYSLRLRVTGDAGNLFAPAIAEIVASLRLNAP